MTHKNSPQRKIGIECAHGFGDGLFLAPLTKAISEQFNTTVGIAVRSHCSDAFFNLPWVDEIITIPSMGAGEKLFSNLGYQKTFQVTPNIWFFHFKERDDNHSLIDTALNTGKLLGIKPFDQRPIFIPTENEALTPNSLPPEPIIAIESIYNSGQSWATNQDFQAIVNKYSPTHKILWLSHTECPSHHRIIQSQHLSRRQLIMCLQRAEIFFSVGSGFFCASMALPKHLQPKKIVCMWIDSLYRYENRLGQLNWHDNLNWVHNSKELQEYI